MSTLTIQQPETEVPTVKNGAKSQHRNEAARQLLRQWREDESDYDETVWPQAKKLIEENSTSARSKGD